MPLDLGLSLPNVSEARLEMPNVAKLGIPRASKHPPRILLLYGSLREHSYSRLLTLEAERILLRMKAKMRVLASSTKTGSAGDEANPGRPAASRTALVASRGPPCRSVKWPFRIETSASHHRCQRRARRRSEVKNYRKFSRLPPQAPQSVSRRWRGTKLRLALGIPLLSSASSASQSGCPAGGTSGTDRPASLVVERRPARGSLPLP